MPYCAFAIPKSGKVELYVIGWGLELSIGSGKALLLMKRPVADVRLEVKEKMKCMVALGVKWEANYEVG